MNDTANLRIWVLADERRGTANQALGVARALGLAFEEKTIRHGRLAWLPNVALGASLIGLQPDSAAQLTAPWPDLVIAAGRRAGAVARWIKRRSGDRAVLVQIMYPGAWGAADYDLIVAPRHDGRSGANILAIDGAPHGIDSAVLADARAKWGARFATFQRPLIGVIVGGATKNMGFDAAAARALGTQAGAAAQAAGGSLVVTSSPRTGAVFDDVLAGVADAGVRSSLVYRWGEEGENPYLAILALADALVVTGDSVSMLSEAAGSGRAVYLYAPRGFASEKHMRLHRDLLASGHIRPFAGRIDSWTHAPLDAAGHVAGEIRRRFARLFGPTFVRNMQ